jgi:hypothetical protein
MLYYTFKKINSNSSCMTVSSHIVVKRRHAGLTRGIGGGINVHCPCLRCTIVTKDAGIDEHLTPGGIYSNMQCTSTAVGNGGIVIERAL